MNQDIKLSRDMQEALDRLVAAMRASKNASDMMDDAFSSLLNINRTDRRCLEIIQHAGQISAGDLAVRSGLTTGAVTTVVDRLERAGYARRARDPSDRRKVFVELTSLAQRLIETVYVQTGEISHGGIAKGLDSADMELITRFLETGTHTNTALAELLQECIDAQAHNSVERLRIAKSFANRVHADRDRLQEEMRKIWYASATDSDAP